MIDLDEELTKVLLAKSDEIDRKADEFLYAWADWCGIDSWLIWQSVGCKSWLGQWQKSTLTQSETTEDAKSLRPREAFDYQMYHAWERVRATMTDQQRELIYFKYQLRRRHETVRRKLGLSKVGYRDEINTIRDRAHDFLNNVLIA